MKILLSILIGAVSIAAFIGILHVVGHLTIKFKIIEKDNDKSEVAIGLVMLLCLVVLFIFCYMFGDLILYFIQN